MGAVQSYIYPNDEPQRMDISELPSISIRRIQQENRFTILAPVPELHILEEHFENQVEKLKAYISMYFLYDGYDHKNSVILKDLEKKLVNQKKELKQLYEKKDMLRNNLDESKDDLIKEKKKNKLYVINIFILLIISIVLFVLIIIKLRPYSELDSNSSNNSSNNISTSFLNKKSNNMLNKLINNSKSNALNKKLLNSVENLVKKN